MCVNRDGTFAPSVYYSCAGGPSSITSADLNGDGHIDLAAADFEADTVSVLINNGDGTFATECANYGTGSSGLNSVTAADFNNDGYIDLAATAAYGNTVNIFINNGNGTFVSTVNYTIVEDPYTVVTNDYDYDFTTSQEPYSVTSADFNKDGYIDLATANTNDNSVSIFLGNGDGTFSFATNYATGYGAQSVTAADFNNDGHIDLATADSQSNTVSIIFGS